MVSPIRSVATNYLRDLRFDQIIQPNHDTTLDFARAVKVFLMSYPEYDTQNSPPLYKQKFQEFLDEMAELYRVTIQGQDFVLGIRQLLETETLEISVGVIKFKGRQQFDDNPIFQNMRPQIEINTSFSQSNPIDLDTSIDVQINTRHRRLLSLNNYLNLRAQNSTISIVLKVGNMEGFKPFQINYQQIHCEGFEDWFTFGNGIELLIRIEFKVTDEPSITDPEVTTFHFYTILLMIERKIAVYRNSATIGTGHRTASHRSKISYIRKQLTGVLTEEAFWTTPTQITDVMSSIRSLAAGTKDDRLRAHTLKYCDLQIPYEYEEEYEGTACLCSQWCNWNAFFYYNPIYRFLVVQHNRLYLKNRTNVPDMYMFAAIFEAYKVTLGNIPLKTPVLQLMANANELRQLLYDRYCWKDPNYTDAYYDNFISIQHLLGLSYRVTRDGMQITQLCLQSDPKLFSDIYIENIMHYFQVFTDLHKTIGNMYEFVSDRNQNKWYTELDRISRQYLPAILIFTYRKCIERGDTSYDYLFSEDYEYSKHVLNTESERRLKERRDKVLGHLAEKSLFNIRILCTSMTYSLNSILKFMQIIDTLLPKPDTSNSLWDMFSFFKHMDEDFNTCCTQTTQRQKFNFIISDGVLTQRGLQNMTKEFTVYYTLKLYSIVFGIQRYSINSLLEFNRRIKPNEKQTAEEFEFIFYNKYIEDKFRTDYFGEELYELNQNIDIYIYDFYDDFWGRSEHELQINPNQILEECITSAYFQYIRHYYWTKNKGYETRIFKKMKDEFRKAFLDICKTSERIFKTYILSPTQILSNRCQYFIETIDLLVYYLVRANCSVILSTVSLILSRVHLLHTKDLVQNYWCFCLTKPGWVHLFRTYKRAIDCVDRVRNLFIIFDDEFERIDNTLNQTIDLVKGIYKDFYLKFLRDFADEMWEVYDMPNADPTVVAFACVHVMIGHSFLVAFYNDFRRNYSYNRFFLYKILTEPPDPNYPQQTAVNTLETICREYEENSNSCQWAQPFQTALWKYIMHTILDSFDQVPPNQLGVDLVLANA